MTDAAAGSSVLHVKVVPGAKRDEIVGRYGDDALKIRVAAPPERGKANSSCVRLLAAWLGVPPAKVSIIRGEAQPRKTFRIEGLTQEQLDAKVRGIC
jgi:uncharacterized protein (TIGR00251 family)